MQEACADSQASRWAVSVARSAARLSASARCSSLGGEGGAPSQACASLARRDGPRGRWLVLARLDAPGVERLEALHLARAVRLGRAGSLDGGHRLQVLDAVLLAGDAAGGDVALREPVGDDACVELVE
jgi:hypothetical protein